MQIQFDPFSFVVAGIAVLISARAYYLARKAPNLERVRQNRDIVRTALRVADEQLLEAEFRLEEGRAIPSTPSEVDEAFEALKEYGPRLPEDGELFNLSRKYWELRRAWRAVTHNDELLSMRRIAVSEAEARVAEATGTTKQAVERARERLAADRRYQLEAQGARDAALTRFRENLRPVRDASREYIDRLDAADRNLK